MKYAMKSTASSAFSDLMRPFAIFALIIVAAIGAHADEPVVRPVTSAYTLDLGHASIISTYLTPLRYTGFNTAVGYERMQAMRHDPDHNVMRLTASLLLDKTANPARNADIWRVSAAFSWGMTYRWRPVDRLTVAAGGSTSLNLGCLYSTRNGNNPVAVEASWTVNATAYATYPVKVWRWPVTLRYQPTLPVVGCFFSPEYGELLYEVYMGNRSGLAHCAWWGNYFRLENILTADIHFGATCLRLGYRGDIFSTSVNHLTTRIITNSLVIGVSGEWMSINPYKPLDNKARRISAFY